MNLHKDIIYVIFGYLSSKNRSEICCVSKGFYQDILDYSKKIWPNIFYTDTNRTNKYLINDYHLLMRLKNKYIMESQMVFTTNDLDVTNVALKYHKSFRMGIITASKYGYLNVIQYLLGKKRRYFKIVKDALFRNAIKYKYMDILEYLLAKNCRICVYVVCKFADLALAKRLFTVKHEDCPVNHYAFILQNRDQEAVDYMTLIMEQHGYIIDLDCATFIIAGYKSLLAVDRLIALGVHPREIYIYAKENKNKKLIKYLKTIGK